MVSTRGVRYKFSEGERVLCYEPDPTKAKVLYDSKVLEVIENKDKRGRRTIEYLIHFQGWNSSWDRCVGEDFVLKDTEENRQLQRDLAEKSQLQLGAYLYRRERKKGSTSGSAGSSAKRSRHRFSDDGSSSSTQPDETEEQGEGDAEDAEGSQESLDEENKEDTESSTESSDNAPRPQAVSPGDHIVPVGRAHLTMPAVLRDRLTFDYHLIVKRNRLTRLPATPCAAQILESFVKWFARAGAWNMPRCRNEPPQKPDLADVSRRLNLVREVADGLRVYFDFIMRGNLLYKPELGQFHEVCGQFLDQQERKMKEELEEEDSQEEYEEEASAEESMKSPKIPEYSHLPPDPIDASDTQYCEEMIPVGSIKTEIKEEPEDAEDMQEDMQEDVPDGMDDMQDMEDQEIQDDEELQLDIKEEIVEEDSQEDIQYEPEEQEESQEEVQEEVPEDLQEINEEEAIEQERNIKEMEEKEILEGETEKSETQVEKEEVKTEKPKEIKRKKSLSLSLKNELKEDEKPLKIKQEKEESYDSQKPQSSKTEVPKPSREPPKEHTKIKDKTSSEDSQTQETAQTQNDPQKDVTIKQEPQQQEDFKEQDDDKEQDGPKKQDDPKKEDEPQIPNALKNVVDEGYKQTMEDIRSASGSEPRCDELPPRRQLLRPNTRSSRRSNNSPALSTPMLRNSPAHGSSSPMLPNSPSVRQNSPALRNNSPALNNNPQVIEEFRDRSAEDPNNFANTVRNQITRRGTRHRRWNNSPANQVVNADPPAPQPSQSANVTNPVAEPQLLLEIKQEPSEPETSRRETRSRRWTNSPAVNSAEEAQDNSQPTEPLITDIKQEPVEAKPGTRSVARRLRSHKSAVSQSENEEPQPSTSTAEPRHFERSSSVGSGSGSSNEEWSKPAEPAPIPSTSTRNPLSQLLDKVSKYEIIPREGTEHLPCRVYGAIHLARLFVRMPDFLNATQMSDFKLKLVVKHIDMFIQYLVEHKEWFGEKYYYCDSMSRST